MKFKRLLTFALAATLSFSALTGCGTTNPDSTSAADTTKTDSSKIQFLDGFNGCTELRKNRWCFCSG